MQIAPTRGFFVITTAIILSLLPRTATAEPAGELEDVVCAATLPCSPPHFEVFDGFKTGPCAPVYKSACDRWKEVKSKADALDVAAAKLVQCMNDKKATPKKRKNTEKKSR